MSGPYQIEQVDRPDWGTIGQGISDYNREHAGDDTAQYLCFLLRAADGEVVGGVIAETYYQWLHIDLMWVKEELRGRGYGRRLLELAEQEARQRGASNAYLDTFSFQAPDFYMQNGYQIFGELPDFPAGHQRTFLTKQLQPL